MLRLLLGKDWKANREEILKRISQDVKNRQGNRILMVPELISHDTERRLCACAGDTASRYAEVLSFTRLYRRVADTMGFAARECLVYIRTYVPEYLPDFEGNIYAQFSDGVFLSSVSAPNYWSANAAEGVRKTLFDESGEVLSLSRSRWGEADW